MVHNVVVVVVVVVVVAAAAAVVVVVHGKASLTCFNLIDWSLIFSAICSVSVQTHFALVVCAS